MDPGQQPTVTQPGPPGYETKQAGGYPVQPGYPAQLVMQGPGTTIIHTQPAQLLVGMRFFENPQAMTCPYCRASIVTATVYEPGTLTWIACGGVALMGGWLGCCLIPFCIDALKDVLHNCPNCKQQVGVFRRV